MKLYVIRNWETTYENNRSRGIKDLQWVPFPNRHDSDGYTMLVSHEDGAAMLGAWVACVQVASRCRPRGTLVRAGGIPHNSASLSRMTRLPEAVIERMLIVATGECNWLECSEINNPAQGCQNPAPACHGTAQGCPERKKERIEGNAAPHSGDGSPELPLDSPRKFPEIPEDLATKKITSVWESWKQYRKENKKPLTPSTAKLQIAKLRELGEEAWVAQIEQSICNGWTGLFPNNSEHKPEPRYEPTL